MRERRNDATIGFGGELPHGGPIRPRDRATGGAIAFGRVDAAREQRLQALVEWRLIQRAANQRVEAERRQVPFVKDQRMALGNRLAVVRLVCNEIEDGARTLPVLLIPPHEQSAV